MFTNTGAVTGGGRRGFGGGRPGPRAWGRGRGAVSFAGERRDVHEFRRGDRRAGLAVRFSRSGAGGAGFFPGDRRDLHEHRRRDWRWRGPRRDRRRRRRGGLFAAGGATFTNSGAVTGGVGGSPGSASSVSGGAGGAGVSFAAGGATFTNSGVGDRRRRGRGTGGIGPGAGGVGVVGAGLTIVNSGVISGGLSGDGVSRADAIDFTGGANVLELRAGSTIIGNVVGTGADLLRLGGAANSAFDASALGTQYQGFGSVEKSGASAWTVTGSTNASAPWTINQGMLIVNGSIANASLTTVNSGATLAGVGGVGNLLVASGGTFAPGMVGGHGNHDGGGQPRFPAGFDLQRAACRRGWLARQRFGRRLAEWNPRHDVGSRGPR